MNPMTLEGGCGVGAWVEQLLFEGHYNSIL